MTTQYSIENCTSGQVRHQRGIVLLSSIDTASYMQNEKCVDGRMCMLRISIEILSHPVLV